jgi:hypothetical protein
MNRYLVEANPNVVYNNDSSGNVVKINEASCNNNGICENGETNANCASDCKCVDLDPGNSYYVDTRGICGACNDENDGSITRPWCSITKAAGILDPGQTVYVRDGVYRETVIINKSGTSNGRITLRNYPEETPVIDGSQIFSDWKLYRNNIWVKNWSYKFSQISAVFGCDPFLFRREQFFQDGEILKQQKYFCNSSMFAENGGKILDLHFDESNGEIVSDSSGFGNDGVLINGTRVSGIKGGALNFDGFGDYVDFGIKDALNLTNNYTISAWIRLNNSVRNSIFGGDYGSQVFFKTNNVLQGRAYLSYSAQSDSYSVYGINTLENNKWYYVAFVVNDRNLSLYVNGILENNILIEKINITNNKKNSYIGQSGMSWSRQWFNGSIDEVSIWNRSLTTREIENEYAGIYCDSKEELEEGSFFIDSINNFSFIRLFENEDPNNHIITTSVRDTGIYIPGNFNVSYVSIIGFNISYQANPIGWGGLSAAGTNLIIENNSFTWTNGIGLYLRVSNTSVKNNFLAYNGEMGMGGGGDSNVYDGNILYNNNLKNICWTWEGGGMKLTRLTNSILKNFHSSNNNGPGIWLDIDNYNNVIENSIVHDDLAAGIMVEISGVNGRNIVRNNIVYNTKFNSGYGFGILVQNSDNTSIYNNLVYNNSDSGIDLHWHSRVKNSSTGELYTMRDNIFKNNILFNNVNYQSFVDADNELVNNNFADYNLYYGSLNSKTNWENWKSLTFNDNHSIWSNPNLSSPEQYYFRLLNSSPAIDAGVNLDEVSEDIEGVSRPQGLSWDIGPYEYVYVICGDGVCSLGEDCSTCSSDCGVCPVNNDNPRNGGGGGGSKANNINNSSNPASNINNNPNNRGASSGGEEEIGSSSGGYLPETSEVNSKTNYAYVFYGSIGGVALLIIIIVYLFIRIPAMKLNARENYEMQYYASARNFVLRARERGYSYEQIKVMFLNKGWSEEQIRRVLE